MEPVETPQEIQPHAPDHASGAPAETPADPIGQTGHPGRDGAWETLRSLLVVIVGVLCIRTFVAEATVIPTGSMENTILIGDHVFLNKLLYGPRIPYTSWRLPEVRKIHRGDIIAFRYPRNPSVMFVKRAIAVGGDVIRIVNKKVYLNGKPLNEPYAHFAYASIFPLRDNFPPSIDEIDRLPAAWGLDPGWAREMPAYIHPDGLHVPRGYVFAMGDNRDNSLDSRFWGFVPLENIVGEPLFVYWSYDAPTRDWTDDDITGRLRFDGSILWNFFSKTRWTREGMVF